MMLNEIISITNPGDMLSGTGKSQSLRDGAFVGLCQSTDDLDPQQNNFMSVLSQVGNGIVPMVSEEASVSNLKLAETPLADEVATDISASEKLKEKSGKSSAVSKRLSSVHPEVFAFVMGLLSIPDPPQSDLPADPGFQPPGEESEVDPAAGLIAGKSMPETTKNLQLPDENIMMTAIPQVSPPGISGSDLPPVAQTEVLSNLQGQRQSGPTSIKDASIEDPVQAVLAVEAQALIVENSESALISGPVSSRLDSAQYVQGEQLPKIQEQRQPDPTSIKGLAVKDLSQVFQGKEVPVQQEHRPDSVSISGKDFSRLDAAQYLQGEQLPKIQEQRQPDPTSIKGLAVKDPAQVFQGVGVLSRRQPDPTSIKDASIKNPIQVVQGAEAQALQEKNPDSVSISGSVVPGQDTIHLDPLTEKEYSGAKGSTVKENSEECVFQNTSVRDKSPVVQKGDAGIRLQGARAKSGSFYQAEDTIETDGMASPSTPAINADIIGTMDAFKSAGASSIITGSDDDPQLQPLEPGSRDSIANFAREGQMEKTISANLSSKEIRPVNQSFQAEVLKQVVEKSAATLKSGQSEIQIDLKPESLGHLRLHVSMENQLVTVKIMAENSQVKEMIERQAYLIKNELQHQGIKVDAVNVDMLMSGGSDFAYSQHEESAFKQARNAPAYGSGQERSPEIEFREPDSQGQGNSRGGYLVNYFA